jgi:hypothetical protein
MANVQFSTCEGSTKSAIVFSWVQVATADGEMAPISPAFSVGSVTSSNMYIPQYMLTAGRSYRLSLTLSLSEDPGRYTQVSYDFSVGVLPLVSNILGGNVIKIGSESELVLDGSQSSDPNIEPSLDQGLTYTWSCVLGSDVFAQACLDQNGNALSLPSARIVTVPKGILGPSPAEDAPYKFSLRVSKPGRCVCVCVWPARVCIQKYRNSKSVMDLGKELETMIFL